MPPLARREVFGIATLTGLVLLAVSGRYGYHRDELYFLEAGKHLAWGYPDQPPLTPLLARLMSAIAPDSLVMLRLPSTLSAAAIVVLAGLMAREFGARRGGQVVAAAGTALSGVVLATGHLLSTATTDLLGWTLLSYLLVRLLLGRATGRSWLLIGLIAGVTLQANVLVGFLLVAGLVAIGVAGPREVLRTPWIGAGVLLAAALVSPYLVWQAREGWPQLDVANGIANGHSGTSEPRWAFLPFQLLIIGPWLTPIWITGLVRCWRDQRLRCLALTYLLLGAVFIATGGKPYYLAGLYPLLLAAGAQPFLDAVRRPWVAPVLLALSTPALVVVLPLLPAHAAGSVVGINYDAGETIGWPEYVEQIAVSYRDLPADTVIVTSNYGEAGAVDRYGPRWGLPGAYSGHNGFADWGPPPAGTERVLSVGLDHAFLVRNFSSVRPVGLLLNREDIDNDEEDVPLYYCTGPRAPWSRLWSQFVHIG
jgi:hypothetical protein